MSDREPTWNPDAHLEGVYRRGRSLLHRRQAGVVAGALLAIALVAVVATNLGSGPADRSRRVATGAPTTATLPAATTTTTGAGSVGLPAPADTTTSTPSGGGGGTGGTSTTRTTRPVAARTTTTVTRTAPTTGAPATTTTSVAPPVDCALTDLSYKTATDAGSYPAGARVTIDLVVTNRSNRTCAAPSNAGLSAQAVVTNSSGGQVFASNPIAITCTVVCAQAVLAPGQSTSYGAASWDNAPRGQNYRAVASRFGIHGAPATFSVT